MSSTSYETVIADFHPSGGLTGRFKSRSETLITGRDLHLVLLRAPINTITQRDPLLSRFYNSTCPQDPFIRPFQP